MILGVELRVTVDLLIVYICQILSKGLTSRDDLISYCCLLAWKSVHI